MLKRLTCDAGACKNVRIKVIGPRLSGTLAEMAREVNEYAAGGSGGSGGAGAGPDAERVCRAEEWEQVKVNLRGVQFFARHAHRRR